MQQYNRTNNILITDPRVLAITIIEKNEELVDLKKQDIIKYGSSPEIAGRTDYTLVRKTVLEMLIQAQTLLPKSINLSLYEGYRSIALQKTLFDKHYQHLKDSKPNLSSDELHKETTKLVSPTINLDGSINIPPHSTGGAVDVYLVDNNDKIIDLGIYTADWQTDINDELSRTLSTKISTQAQKNRAILSQAMSDAGFVNYFTEYWHWSYGDKYWAYIMKQPNAIYTSILNI